MTRPVRFQLCRLSGYRWPSCQGGSLTNMAGVDARTFARDLVLAVRKRARLRHRIPCAAESSTSRLPPGLETTYTYPQRTVAADWEAAEADWAHGTVVVFTRGDGTKVRLPIEVMWQDVENYMSLRLRQSSHVAALPVPVTLPDAAISTPAEQKKPPQVPYHKLLRWWLAEYLPKHPDPDKRPDVETQQADAVAAFRYHTPPSADTMQKLRADKHTPPEWKEAGRRPKSD